MIKSKDDIIKSLNEIKGQQASELHEAKQR